jgi:hypothetical protein
VRRPSREPGLADSTPAGRPQVPAATLVGGVLAGAALGVLMVVGAIVVLAATPLDPPPVFTRGHVPAVVTPSPMLVDNDVDSEPLHRDGFRAEPAEPPAAIVLPTPTARATPRPARSHRPAARATPHPKPRPPASAVVPTPRPTAVRPAPAPDRPCVIGVLGLCIA